jgi:hypothetical protein
MSKPCKRHSWQVIGEKAIQKKLGLGRSCLDWWQTLACKKCHCTHGRWRKP